MYQTITTKYLGATNTRGSRIRVSTTSGKFIYVPWDHALDSLENHKAAARVLIRDLTWNDGMHWYFGSAGEKGYVFVQVPIHGATCGNAILNVRSA